jgi:hypothetical protein
VNLVDLLEQTYPGVTRMHQYASESVKATGNYPVSTIVRTPEDETDNDVNDAGTFTFDEPIITKKKVALLQKPSPEVKKSVEQFVHLKTL